MKTITLSDVAKAARVSKATASNVFSRPERVRPALRDRVKAAAESLGYDGPDPKGKLLSSGKVNAIGIVPAAAFGISLFFRDPYNRDFLAGVAEVCEEHGAGLSLVSGRNDQQAWGIRNAVVDGFIFNSIEQVKLLTPAKQQRLRFVVMDDDAGPDINSVRVMERDGARLSTEHLLALGHRRILIALPLQSLQPPVFHAPGSPHGLLPDAGRVQNERLEGAAEALAAAGVDFRQLPLVEACGTPEEATAFGDGIERLLNALDGATAVLAFSDKLALGVINYARRRGIHVPAQLSVVGFDDIPEAAVSDPPLTTVVNPTMDKGREAARMLLTGGKPRQALLPVSLALRGSTGPPLDVT